LNAMPPPSNMSFCNVHFRCEANMGFCFESCKWNVYSDYFEGCFQYIPICSDICSWLAIVANPLPSRNFQCLAVNIPYGAQVYTNPPYRLKIKLRSFMFYF